MTHALARRRRHAGDVGHHRLADMLTDEGGRGFLVAAADLAHHDDAFGLRILFEQLQHVDEVHAAHRIAADADASALAQAVVGGLKYRLVGQRAGARHDAHPALLVDEARHDADLAFARGDDAGAIGADEPRLVARSAALTRTMSFTGMPSVMQTISSDAGVRRFENRIGRERRRHVNHAHRRRRFWPSLPARCRIPASPSASRRPSRGDAAHELCAVRNGIVPNGKCPVCR